MADGSLRCKRKAPSLTIDNFIREPVYKRFHVAHPSNEYAMGITMEHPDDKEKRLEKFANFLCKGEGTKNTLYDGMDDRSWILEPPLYENAVVKKGSKKYKKPKLKCMWDRIPRIEVELYEEAKENYKDLLMDREKRLRKDNDDEIKERKLQYEYFTGRDWPKEYDQRMKNDMLGKPSDSAMMVLSGGKQRTASNDDKKKDDDNGESKFGYDERNPLTQDELLKFNDSMKTQVLADYLQVKEQCGKDEQSVTKHNQEKNIEFGEIVGKHPFRLVAAGSTGTGKSNVIQYLLKRFWAPFFDHIYLFSGTLEFDMSWENLIRDGFLKRDKCKSQMRFEDIQEAVQKNAAKIRSTKKKRGLENILIIIDDFAGDREVMNNRKFIKMVFTYRHLNVSFAVLTQKWVKIDVGYRQNLSNAIVFTSQNGREYEAILDDLTTPLVTREQFIKIFEEATKERWSFLHVNHQCEDKRAVYRKNFDKVLYITQTQSEMMDQGKEYGRSS